MEPAGACKKECVVLNQKFLFSLASMVHQRFCSHSPGSHLKTVDILFNILAIWEIEGLSLSLKIIINEVVSIVPV